MTLDLTYIIGGVAATGVVLYFAWPAFKQMINIKAGNAVNGATKASEKLRAEQITLTADVKKQLTAVATIKGAAEAAERDVKAPRLSSSSSPATSRWLSKPRLPTPPSTLSPRRSPRPRPTS
ncbi:MAG: hypothetical protein IPP97_09385 [Candidatus Obscuribacter sp.]|nr:hypothetical protein [Candidatus Obscuribacter sp.]